MLRDNLVDRTTIDGGVDAMLFFIDGRQLGQEESIRDAVYLCVKNETHLLIVNYGTPLQGDLLESPFVRTIVAEKDDFVQVALAFVDFISDLHAYRVRERAEYQHTVSMFKQQKEEAALRRYPIPLPSRAVNYDWIDTHLEDPTMTINIALYGATNTGKTTFATALLDGFVLREHEVTRGLETGTFAVALAGGAKINATLFDGAVSRVPLVALGLVFVDLSSPTAIEDAGRSILGIKTPPHMCVVATKGDCGVNVDPVALSDFAGSIPAHLVEIDGRVVQMELVARLMMAMVDADVALRRKTERTQVLRDHRLLDNDVERKIPTTDEGLDALFQRYDLDGNGTIDIKEAEALYEEFNAVGFGNCRAEIAKIQATMSDATDRTRITFNQFCLLMCRLANM